jgi:hypothetical protein
MNQLATIDSLALLSVHGGEANTELSGGFKTPTLEAQGKYTSSALPERKSPFTTCVNDQVYNQSGLLEKVTGASQSTLDNAAWVCRGEKGSPQNP